MGGDSLDVDIELIPILVSPEHDPIFVLDGSKPYAKILNDFPHLAFRSGRSSGAEQASNLYTQIGLSHRAVRY